MTRAGGGDSGQALIETALTLPLLLLMLLGAFEFGRCVYASIEITNAAKAAAQYGAQNSTTAADINGMKLVAMQDAPDLSLTAASTTIDNTNCECIVNGVAGTASAAMCATTAICLGYVVQVLKITTTTTYQPVLFHKGGFSSSFTLQGHAVQEVLQ